MTILLPDPQVAATHLHDPGEPLVAAHPSSATGHVGPMVLTDHRVLVEEVQVGREIDVAVLGRPEGRRIVAPMLEIVVDGLFDLTTEHDGSATFRIPAEVLPFEQGALTDAAVAMYDALGCRGVARVDFFLTPSGPVLNEVNKVPGFTSQSQVPTMFAASGTSYVGLVDLLVRDALG